MLRGFFQPPQGAIGWYDNADAATQTVPLVHTGGVDTILTNDGLGVASGSFDPLGIGNLWDADNDQFDFSDLNVGSIMWLRTSFEVTTSMANQEVNLLFDGAIGGVNPFSIHVYQAGFKTAGIQAVSRTTAFYIGTVDTRDFPMKLRFTSPNDATIKVTGWFVPVLAVPA